jgi:putative ABC transport system permease protein
VQWGVRLFKGLACATAPDGKFRTVILMGIDDSTLAGAPHHEMLLGSFSDLGQVDSVAIDRAGYLYYFPDEPPHNQTSVQVYSGIW